MSNAMNRMGVLKKALLPGAVAGILGGLVLGAVTARLGQIATIASLLEVDSPTWDSLLKLMAAAVIGSVYGLLVWQLRPGAGEKLFWGLTYGLLWWAIGPLTLVPLLRGPGIAWDLPSAQANVPALIGHLLFGATLGLALATLRRDRVASPVGLARPLIRGGLAGVGAAVLLSLMLDAQNRLRTMNEMLPDMMAARTETSALLATIIVGLVAGLIYAWLYPVPFDGAGAGLIRGFVYGFTWWIVGDRTAIALLRGDGEAWSLGAIRSEFASLPGYLLFGVALVLSYLLLYRLIRLLLSDDIGRPSQEGVGSQALRALGRGILAGSIGGLVFSVVMVQIGFLTDVASLIRATSPTTGFIVHLGIANIIGMTYGLLFNRQSYDAGSALAWGVSYGVFWWFLGALTLMPIILGGPPTWTAHYAAELFAALVGHLAYGAAVGIVVYLLEARYRPWWVSRTATEEARISQRKEQIATSAPALWVLTVVMALTLPVFLGT